MNIFEISRELDSIFDELEENGGELTEELEEQLSISQDEFTSKVKAYLSVIKRTESDVECCDKEIKRLQDVKRSKQNSIEKLKNILIWAIDKFGEVNKSGNKYIDLGTDKLTIRNSEKVVVNDDYAKSIVENIFNKINAASYTNELYNNSIEDIIDIAKEDVKGINTTISIDIPLEDLYTDAGDNIITSLFTYTAGVKAKPNISKTQLKQNLTTDNNAYKNLAHIEPNKSLIIK